ncbi:hypothetical protein [Comamonas thiooxydans]|uniref:hypothetical protein n=1 Tax=Comamonas thiooxydans TaxID=363952 RepID=UPI001184B853|nr:hypothetical protein [Comamonas thiooxydans]
MTLTPKFSIGQKVFVPNPEQFLAAFAAKVKGRKAVVLRLVKQYSIGASATEKVFSGYLIVEFQKRNGRGTVFSEKIHQDYLRLVPASAEESNT